MLRRAGSARGQTGDGGPFRVADLEVDPVRHEMRVGGRLVECTPTEFSIVSTLAAEPGRAFTRHQLLTEAFGFDHYVLDRTVDVHVMNLRRKVEPEPTRPRYLLTVYGVGYKMASEDDDAP